MWPTRTSILLCVVMLLSTARGEHRTAWQALRSRSVRPQPVPLLAPPPSAPFRFSSGAKSSTILCAKKPNTKAKPSVAPLQSLSRKNRIQSLLDWAQRADVQVSKEIALDSRVAEYGLGWYASTNIPTNQVLLSVPSNRALTVEIPGEGPDDRSVLDLVASSDSGSKTEVRALPWFVQMSLYIYKLDQVDANKEGVDMRPWLDSLPRSFDTVIHWSEANRQELQYDSMVTAVASQEQDWKRYYQSLLQAGASSSSLTWEQFLWGCEIARSRAFSGGFTGSAFNPGVYAFTLLLVTIYVGLGVGSLEQAANGAGVVFSASILKDFVLPKLFKKRRYVICPMIDMANHQSVKFAGQVSFEYFANAYSLATDQAIPSGDEVYISYGPRSNDQLLQYYGFVERNNPNDVYVMPPLREWDIEALERATDRKFAVGRLEKLNRAGLLGSATTVLSDKKYDETEVANANGGVVITRVLGLDPAILQALRALVSTEDEWNAAGQAVGSFAEEGSGGAANEAAARLAARTAVGMELQSKETTLQEDEALLQRMDTVKSMDASREEKLAVQFRIEKKKLLSETLDKLSVR